MLYMVCIVTSPLNQYSNNKEFISLFIIEGSLTIKMLLFLLQEVMMTDVLKNCESALKEFNPNFTGNLVNTKKILLMELKAYSSCTE